MNEVCLERSVSRGIKENVHGIVQYQFWSCVDVVLKKRGMLKECISNIQLRCDELNSGLLHINFIEEQMIFSIKTLTGSNRDLVLWYMDDDMMLMTKEESGNVLLLQDDLKRT